jgi:HK97 family phage portal protein
VVTIKIPFLSKWFRSFKNSTLATPTRWLTKWFGGGVSSHSGVTVNENTALYSTAVFACVRVLAETVASLPLPVYKRLKKGGKERDPTHPLYRVLHDQANEEMTSFTWRETMMGHLLTWGNAYSEIEWGNDGNVKALWPLRPDKTWPERNPKTKKLEYYTVLPDDTSVKLPTERILHLKGLSPNGLVGYSPIRMAREAIGLSLATEEFGARFFGDGAHPGGIVEYPGSLSDEAYDRYKNDVRNEYSGLSKSHRLMVLEEGLKYHQVGIPPEDAQFLETRKFQVSEIARIYRVPPHMIGDLDRATFSNVEQQSLDFVIHTVRPWLVRWEQELKMNLFITPRDKRRFFTEFLVDGLLRGDIESRFKAYQIGIQNGWYNRDEIREKENDNPIEGGLGKIYTVNAATIPLGNFDAPKGGEDSNG